MRAYAPGLEPQEGDIWVDPKDIPLPAGVWRFNGEHWESVPPGQKAAAMAFFEAERLREKAGPGPAPAQPAPGAQEQDPPQHIWGQGPWVGEPDEWQGEYEGFTVHALRMLPMGQWNGYLSLPPGHPWHGQDFDDIDADVHGGLTFSRANGMQKGDWLVGFDCAHAFDLMPGQRALLGRLEALQSPEHQEMTKKLDAIVNDSAMPHRDIYRTLEYVQGELRQLATQAAAARPKE